MKRLTGILSAALVTFFIGQASAAIMVTDLGTVAPPATLGGFTMTPFGDDGITPIQDITSLASPLGGQITFGATVSAREVGDGWATWSHGYTGDVYYTNGATSLSMTLPAGTGAFYLYAEPNPFATFAMRIEADDGTGLEIDVSGSGGANGWGFWGTGGTQIVSLSISTTTDFAVGEFGIATVPEPGTLALLGLGLAGLAATRRRKQ